MQISIESIDHDAYEIIVNRHFFSSLLFFCIAFSTPWIHREYELQHTLDFTHTRIDIIIGRTICHLHAGLFFHAFTQSSTIIIDSFYRKLIVDAILPKIFAKLFTINEIIADYLPLNDLGTSCYGQKQMKKIHCFEFYYYLVGDNGCHTQSNVRYTCAVKM